MPNQPATQVRGFRLPDPLWQLLTRAAADDGSTVTDVVVDALVRAMRERYPYEPLPRD